MLSAWEIFTGEEGKTECDLLTSSTASLHFLGCQFILQGAVFQKPLICQVRKTTFSPTLAAPGTKPLASSLHTELLNSIKITILWNSLKFSACPTLLLCWLPICFHENHGKHSRKLLCSVLSFNFVPAITRDIVNLLIKPKRFFFFITWKDFAA